MLLDVTGTLVIDGQTRESCRLPYPGHPHGCPNYGRGDECPPKVSVVSEVLAHHHGPAMHKNPTDVVYTVALIEKVLGAGRCKRGGEPSPPSPFTEDRSFAHSVDPFGQAGFLPRGRILVD